MALPTSKPRAGSSPLTRGKQHGVVAHEEVPGLIPAHAGKTNRGETEGGGGAAHPRSRGENRARRAGVEVVLGSSPLTRGKHGYGEDYVREVRLIPAHAGKTFRVTATINGARAHPRSRGENSGRHSIPMVLEGSSPLTRGKRVGENRRS